MSRTIAMSLTCLAILTVAAFAAPPRTLEIGEKAPDFKLPAADGKTYALADFDDAGVLVIIFTCNHCPTSQAYEARIKKLAADYKNKSVAIVAISPNDPLAVRFDELGYSDVGDSLADMKIRAKDAAFNFPYLYDGRTQAVSKVYGPIATPHVFIFDRERTLRYQGGFDDSEKPKGVRQKHTRNAIEALLSDREVAAETTKVFGCSTKWADKRASAAQRLEEYAKEPVKLNPITTAKIADLAANNSAKLRLVSIWATWSGPGIDNLAELVTANRMYRKRDFELITISIDRSPRGDRVLKTLADKQASCTNYIYYSDDLHGLMWSIDPKLAGGIPYTLLIKPGGEIIYRKVGPIDPLDMRKAIVEYLGRVY